MARKIVDTEPDITINIEDVVKKYYGDKLLEKGIKDDLKVANEQIKSYMKHIDKTSESFGEYSVNISVQDKSTMNEDKLLEFIRTSGVHSSIIKTKEYVDMDALEEAIYRGEFSKEQLADMNRCKEPKDVVTLRVTKAKKKKEDE